MTESVEWAQLADHDRPEPPTASAVAPMTDERLAEIQQLAARSRAFVARHLTAALHELLAEIDRLRVNSEADWRGLTTALEGWDEEAGNAWRSYAEQLARAAKAEAEVKRLNGRLEAAWRIGDKLGTDLFAAHVRADAAERELAELRERIGEQREEWGVRTYDDDTDTEVMRTREQAEDLAAAWRTEIPNSNPTVRVRTQCAPGPWRDVDGGEWKAADDV